MLNMLGYSKIVVIKKLTLSVTLFILSFSVNSQNVSKPTAPLEHRQASSIIQQADKTTIVSRKEEIEKEKELFLKNLKIYQDNFTRQENWNHHLKAKYYADITPRLGKPKEFQEWVNEERIRKHFKLKFKGQKASKYEEKKKLNKIIVLQPDIKIWREENRLAPLQAEVDALIMLLTDSSNYKEIQKAFFQFSTAYHTNQNGFQQILQLSKLIHAITKGKENAEQSEQFLHTLIPVFFAMASAPQKNSSKKAKENNKYLTMDEMRSLAIQACYFVMDDKNNGQNTFVHKVAQMSFNTLLSCQVHGYEEYDRQDVRRELLKQKGFHQTMEVAILSYLTINGIIFKDKANRYILELSELNQEVPFLFSQELPKHESPQTEKTSKK